MRLILSILAILLLTSCCRRNISHTISKEVKTETIYRDSTRYIDTTLYIDSSVSVAHIICDTLLVPHLVFVNPVSGKRTISVKTNSVQSGLFTITCPADSLRAIVAAKDRYITTLEKTLVNESTTVEEKKGFWVQVGLIAKHIIYMVLTMLAGIILYVLIRK
jgi:uncharacterized protein YceK